MCSLKQIKAERRHNENYKILKIRYERQDLCPVYIYLPSLSYLHGIIVLAHSMDVGLGHRACFGQLEYGHVSSISRSLEASDPHQEKNMAQVVTSPQTIPQNKPYGADPQSETNFR